MQRFIIRRLLLLIPIVIGVATITFIMIHAIPGDPIEIIAGQTRQLTPEERARIAESFASGTLQRSLYITVLQTPEPGIIHAYVGRGNHP